jgi:hypothetical protein
MKTVEEPEGLMLLSIKEKSNKILFHVNKHLYVLGIPYLALFYQKSEDVS